MPCRLWAYRHVWGLPRNHWGEESWPCANHTARGLGFGDLGISGTGNPGGCTATDFWVSTQHLSAAWCVLGDPGPVVLAPGWTRHLPSVPGLQMCSRGKGDSLPMGSDILYPSARSRNTDTW